MEQTIESLLTTIHLSLENEVDGLQLTIEKDKQPELFVRYSNGTFCQFIQMKGGSWLARE